MATLYQKIKEIHPSLTHADFVPFEGTISLRNDTGIQSDDYIEADVDLAVRTYDRM